MAEPSSPVVSSTPKSQPSEIQKRYDEAGYARNTAELRYNNAKKEFGADSPEAKTALTELQAAQAKVEAIQAELRGEKKAAPAKSNTPPPPEAKPKESEAALKKFATFSSFSREIELPPRKPLKVGTYFFSHQTPPLIYSSEMVRTMTVLLDKAPLHQGLSDYLKSDPKLLEACKKNPDCAALLDAKDSKPAAAKPEEKK